MPGKHYKRKHKHTHAPIEKVSYTRKFIIKNSADLKGIGWKNKEYIYEKYLPIDAKGQQMMLLSVNNEKFAIIVNGLIEGKLTQSSIPIDKNEFKMLHKSIEGYIVKKSVYHTKTDPSYKVTTYDNSKLIGLILVEVKFDNKDEADAFIPPSFFNIEVTGDSRYTDKELAMNGIPIE